MRADELITRSEKALEKAQQQLEIVSRPVGTLEERIKASARQVVVDEINRTVEKTKNYARSKGIDIERTYDNYAYPFLSPETWISANKRRYGCDYVPITNQGILLRTIAVEYGNVCIPAEQRALYSCRLSRN